MRNKDPDVGDSGRILPFRRRRATASGYQHPLGIPRTGASSSPVEGMDRYERAQDEADDYRHRQMVNIAAFAICVLLVLLGVWLAVKIADLTRDQDCVLAGRRNCAQISISGEPR